MDEEGSDANFIDDEGGQGEGEEGGRRNMYSRREGGSGRLAFLGEQSGLDDTGLYETRIKKKITLKDIYEPAELEQMYETEADQGIIATDVPERLQMRYKAKFPDNVELIEEANWIFEKLKVIKSLPPDENKTMELKSKIMKVLEHLRINNFEIMYIYNYKKQDLHLGNNPLLTLEDLWELYDLDQEWGVIYSKR
jgi:hypothetical protein